tara:strand:- start:47 stop:229 length:183 start_codon:yes stop_codon:yes gene_type:complete
MQLVFETIIIGILTLILYFFIEKNIKNMYLRIFILGASIHLFCEFTGINRWYCKNGNACK